MEQYILLGLSIFGIIGVVFILAIFVTLGLGLFFEYLCKRKGGHYWVDHIHPSTRLRNFGLVRCSNCGKTEFTDGS